MMIAYFNSSDSPQHIRDIRNYKRMEFYPVENHTGCVMKSVDPENRFICISWMQTIEAIIGMNLTMENSFKTIFISPDRILRRFNTFGFIKNSRFLRIF